jgi:hypothetical protein
VERAPRLSAVPKPGPATELAGIVAECYAFVERNRRVLALIERSAVDIPELYDFGAPDRPGTPAGCLVRSSEGATTAAAVSRLPGTRAEVSR